MDRFHTTFDVYTDAGAAGNHFGVRARMSSQDSAKRPGAESTVPTMDEAFTENPHSGTTCIKASFKSKVENSKFNWGGWYFMNGVQNGVAPASSAMKWCQWPTSSSAQPEFNWGSYAEAGVDLRGAKSLTFWARGEKGGERVEFFALGIGWDADSKPPQTQPDPCTQEPFAFPDSSPKVSTGYISLAREWTQYTLDLRGRDLSYALGGFGWAASAVENGLRDITFYLDDIQYQKPRLDEPRFLVSYETLASNDDFDRVSRSTAQTYDNALALMAFLATGEVARARKIADAFVYAQEHDRFQPLDRFQTSEYAGSLRNAYQGGDLALPPGWLVDHRARTVRMPGFTLGGARDPDALIPGDLNDPVGLRTFLLHSQDAVSSEIRRLLGATRLEEVTQIECNGPPRSLRQSLVVELNRLLAPGAGSFACQWELLQKAYPEAILRRPEGWVESKYDVSLNTGNIAWAMLALLSFHDMGAAPGETRYLEAARKMGEWVERNCRDRGSLGGYTGGREGWEPDALRVTYESTEHNIDLYAAFLRLHRITGDPVWLERSRHAGSFVKHMWDEVEGKFWTGTDDGFLINNKVIPLDIQAWAALALRDEALLSQRDKERALAYVERTMKREGGEGYDYSQRKSHRSGGYESRQGVWYEGTAQMAVAYRVLGQSERYRRIVEFLESSQLGSGALNATDQDAGLPTGFKLSDGECNRYYKRAHVGATAWFIFAERGVNPYWLGNPAPPVPND